MRYNDTSYHLHRMLAVIGAGGLMGVVVSASHALAAFEQLDAFDNKTSRLRRQRLIAELRRQDLIVETHESEGLRLQLSVKGIHRLQRMEIEQLDVATPNAWDGHWHMVVFDIPASHKNERYVFTSLLKRLGFVMIRQSTWYHPYPCSEVVDQVVRYCNLSRFVTMAEVVRLDSSTQRTLLRHYAHLILPSP